MAKMCKFQPQIIPIKLFFSRIITDMKIFENWNFLESYKKVCLKISFLVKKSSITDVKALKLSHKIFTRHILFTILDK